MHRSNRISFLLTILFLLFAGLAWLWIQDVDQQVRTWAAWATAGYGTLAGFLTWLHGLRFARLINDIPTSQIASAAQGYVELLGHAAPYHDQQAKTSVSTPVLWYRKEYAARAPHAGRHVFPFNLVYTPVETEESRTPFAIDDGTGTACVLPHGAEIICQRREVRYGDDTRVVEEQIRPGDVLYVIGHFSSYTMVPDLDHAALELTRQWEQEPHQRGRFDLDRDGRLSTKEWLAMHEAARLEAIRRDADGPDRTPHHLVFEPASGLPFLISSVPPAILAGRYRFYLIIGLALFVACGAMLAASLAGTRLI